METLEQKMKEENKLIGEKIDKSNEKTSETLKQVKEDIETLSDKIEYNQETLQKELTEYREEKKQTIMETKEKIERTNETVMQVREEILNKVNEAEGESKRRIEGLQQKTTEKFEQVQTRVEERYNQLDASVSKVKGTTTAHEGNIEESRVRELRLQEEINALKDRPLMSSHVSCSDNREIVNFKNHKRNPIEFLERVEESLARTRETRWTVIKGMLDEMFKDCLLYTSRCV